AIGVHESLPAGIKPYELRSHLRELEARDLLVRVRRSIDKDTEMHPLVRWQFRGLPEAKRKAFLFESVRDSRGRVFDIPVVVGALAGSEEIYTLSMGCTSDEVLDRWSRALANPIPARVVDEGPVQEVVWAGDTLMERGGLDELPVPMSTPGFDNAPYFNSAIWVTKDPETCFRNAGVYRGMIKSPLRTGVFCDSNNNTSLNWEKHNALGRPMPAAAVIGAPPAVYLSAIQMTPVGVDELAVAGALIGEPLELVRCKTVDIEVPAYAEIVVEGIIRTDYLEPEGSFGEAHGYCDPRSLSFSFEVTAITHRRDPIFLSIISQLTPSESSKTKQSGYETQVLRYLRDSCGLRGVQRVSLREDLMNRQVCVVVLRKTDRYEPMNALYSMLSQRQTPKLMVAVDDDIDPTDDTVVNWAIVNRSQPHRDLHVIHPRITQFGPLRYVANGENYDREDSAILIDATRKADLPPIALPAREFMERARELWQELGLPELEPRSPWHGYSLGLWPADQANEADLATQGRYFETGEKLIGKQRQVPRGTRLKDVRTHDL